MRDPNRIDELCKELAEIWKMYPDFRLGQLIDNTFNYMKKAGREPFYVEDKQFLKYIEAFMLGKTIQEVNNYVEKSTEDLAK